MGSKARKELRAEAHGKVTLGLRVTTKEGKETVVSRVEGDVERRFSRKPHGAIQLVWKSDEAGVSFVHIHCKTHNCNNEWKIEEGKSPTEKFEVRPLEQTLWHIKCKQCGTEYTTG
jgi:hypothetical protein